MSVMEKSTFVHNCVVNKNKVNTDHFHKIYNHKSFSKNKLKILQTLHANSIDFRKMVGFKNALFDSEELKDNHLVPIHVWNEEAQLFCLDAVFKEMQAEVKAEMMRGDYADLANLVDIIDLFFYLPMTKPYLKNDSKDIYFIMSSNTKGGHEAGGIYQGGKLKRMLDLLWLKISERFKCLAEAYRYFDVNFNNRVSFSEF